MDLKSKSTKWVGNIYQKFEAICHEVDDFVTQDTVKYVENQVQTVGYSVKRFYSDVVQDLIPSEVKPGKYESQALCPTPDYTFGTPVSSMIDYEENHVYYNNINQSSVDEYPINLLKNTHEHFMYQPSVDGVRLVKSDLSLGPEVNALKDKKFDIVLEVNEAKEEVVDSKSNIVIEANDTEERMMGEKSSMVVGENGAEEEPSQPEEFELISIENKNMKESSLLSEYIGEKNGILSEIPAATSVCSTQKEKVCCDSFLDVACVSDTSSVLTHSDMDSSVVSSECRIPEVGLISSVSSLFMGTYGMSEFSDGNVIGGVSDLSNPLSFSQSIPILVCDNKVSDMGLTFSRSSLSLDSKDTSTIEDAASLVGSSAYMHEYCYECAQLEVLMPSLEIGGADNCSVDITDPSMETIELYEKTELDEGCVVVDSKLLYADSCRAQRHRSYKKILRDAFASKKRISKEYEQLGILYGDIDIESSQQRPQNLLVPSSSLDSKKSPSQDTWDPEWELL